MRILTALITYNRLYFLKRCLKNIQLQTYKSSEILVVNNSSTDGTEEFLRKSKINFLNQENLGSASGWYTCIEYAIDKNFDYIWLMDDDGFPDLKSLEILKKEILLDKNLVCASSVVVDEKNKNKLVFPLPILDQILQPKLFGFRRKYYFLNELTKQGLSYYPYSQLFNGALISLKNLKNFENINKNYFIFGEEVDFFWRLKKKGKVISILNSYQFHPNVSEREYTNIKIYYYIKNTIINNFKYFTYPNIRNFLTILIITIRIYKRNGLVYLLKILFGKYRNYFYLAIKRGYKNELKVDHNELF